MPAAAVTGAGVLVSAWSAYEGGKRADRAMKMQQGAMNQDLAFRQALFNEWKNTYGPLEKDLVNQAASDQPLNLGPEWAKIQSNFDQAGRNQESALSRSGGLGQGYQRNSNLEVGRAAALSDAYSQGLQRRDALRMNLFNASKQMPGQAGNLSQGFQNMAGLYGNQANTFANASAAGWQGVGTGLSNMGYLLGQSTKPEAKLNNGVDNGTLAAGLNSDGSAKYETPGAATTTQARLMDARIYNGY